MDLLGEALFGIRKGQQLTEKQVDAIRRLEQELISRIEQNGTKIDPEILLRVFEVLRLDVHFTDSDKKCLSITP